MARNDVVTHEVLEAAVSPVRQPELSESSLALAASIELDLTAPTEVQLARCDEDSDIGTRAAVRMGLRLLAIKARCKDGEFEEVVAGLKAGRATRYRCMQMATAYAAAGPQRAQMLLGMGQSKALAYLAADPEVQSQIIESPELLREAFESSKREFERKLKAMADELERAKRKAETSELQAQQAGNAERVLIPNMPNEVTDVRREVAALFKKANLAIRDMADLANSLEDAGGVAGGAVWLEPTARQVLIAMSTLHAQVSMQMRGWADRFDLDGVDAAMPDAADRAFYKPEEAAVVQTHFQTLLALHADQAERRANRAHNERSLGRKRGKV